jgi:hypothetical protein
LAANKDNSEITLKKKHQKKPPSIKTTTKPRFGHVVAVFVSTPQNKSVKSMLVKDNFGGRFPLVPYQSEVKDGKGCPTTG